LSCTHCIVVDFLYTGVSIFYVFSRFVEIWPPLGLTRGSKSWRRNSKFSQAQGRWSPTQI